MSYNNISRKNRFLYESPIYTRETQFVCYIKTFNSIFLSPVYTRVQLLVLIN